MKRKILSLILALSLTLGLNLNALADSYTVKPGDTLWGLAEQFYDDGQKYTDIYDVNKGIIEDADKIYPGQKIEIPDVEISESETETIGSENASHANGEPWINSNLQENVTDETPTDPKEDIYLYSNKDWILSHTIPAGKNSWSEYSQVETENTLRCIKLLNSPEDLKSEDGKLVKQLYDAYLNWDERNAEGVTSLKKITDVIESVESLEVMNLLITDEDFSGLGEDFSGAIVDTGLTNPDKYIVFIDSELSLVRDDADEYSSLSEYGRLLEKYRREQFLYILGRLGYSDEEAIKKFENVLRLDGMLAPRMFTNGDIMAGDYYERINNEMDYYGVVALYKNFPIEDCLEALGLVYDGEYVVVNPDYVKAFDELYTDDNLELFKDRMIYDLCVANAEHLDKEMYDKSKEIYNRNFGVTGVTPENENALEMILEYLPNQMARVYIEKYSSKEDRDRITEVCLEVIDTYKEIINENDWLSKESKEACIRKLEKMRVNVGWPDKWDDYRGLDLDGLSLQEMLDEISIRNNELRLAKLGKNIDRDMWAFDNNILTCNAWYSFTDNAISIIIGMMGEPFYYSDMPIEELYASIGAFWVGHEVSHAFDSVGATFDENGALGSWWSKSDEDEFARRVKKVDDYLDGIRIMGDYYVTGSNVDSEMIADFTGVQCALHMARKIPDFDYKKFFEYYAKMNVCIALYNSQITWIKSDDHPLDYLRGNVPVQQFEEFYEAYDIGPDDRMYLAPEDRFVIW